MPLKALYFTFMRMMAAYLDLNSIDNDQCEIKIFMYADMVLCRGGFFSSIHRKNGNNSRIGGRMLYQRLSVVNITLEQNDVSPVTT